MAHHLKGSVNQQMPELTKVVLTSLLSAAVLFLIAKVLGHKQVAQLDFFDYITGITIGSIAAELATELENPLKPLTAMTVYGAIGITLSFLSCKLRRDFQRSLANPANVITKIDFRVFF